ncbi:LysR family substrate-binding domain-containing protein [Streptomyces sp. DSM 44915]|uniref:LysR family substrate-binding domain-containing protein n=1 Tax=Streptomyces chisholmiae TaxID=3075540 RepID=A0ABU2JXD2_9ACTN|nr:LysR family substrate-binding domain-containing protein [Streptomyces sp. DSM 44915]MDT0269655.1 LysR family substrate-binding domain-containing protein [Streptomyces sp. DSM 44915]
MTGSDVPPSFRLAYVPGVIPAKWVRIWQERMPDVPLTLSGVPAAEAAAGVREGRADAVFGRLPLDRAELSVIPLYVETTVVVVPKDHLVAAVDEVAVADLADELLLHPLDDTLPWERPPGRPAVERPASTGDAVELVAAGVGLLVVPQSLARLHHRKDLTYRPVTDAPTSQVGLCWREDRTTDLMETFIGIVRGRTVNSSRGRPTPPREKAKEKPKARRPAAGDPRGAGSAGRSGGRSGGGSGGAGGRNPRRGAGGAKPAKRRKPRR